MTREELAEKMKDLPNLPCRVNLIQQVWEIMNSETEQLEKENAKLKGLKEIATLIRANNDTIVTLMQMNNKLVSKSQQLNQAKELLRKLYEETKGYINDQGFDMNVINEVYAFLNREVEK